MVYAALVCAYGRVERSIQEVSPVSKLGNALALSKVQRSAGGLLLESRGKGVPFFVILHLD